MAHTRSDTWCRPPEWWKHLRWWKKFLSRRERKAAKKRIKQELEN